VDVAVCPVPPQPEIRNAAVDNVAPKIVWVMNALRGKCMKPPSELRGG
jgi:hypothetical protein